MHVVYLALVYSLGDVAFGKKVSQSFTQVCIATGPTCCDDVTDIMFEHNGKTVMMAPASGFYATKGLGQDEARIAYVLEKAALADAVECLSEALKVYPGRLQTASNISQEGSL